VPKACGAITFFHLSVIPKGVLNKKKTVLQSGKKRKTGGLKAKPSQE